MRFTTVSGVFAFVALAQGLVVPEGASTGASSLRRWSNDGIYCGCGFNMDSYDTDQAVGALKGMFVQGQDIKPGTSLSQRVGSVIAFACNLSQTGHSYEPEASIMTKALGDITNACGRYIAGAEAQYGSPDQPHGDGFQGEFYYGYQRWEDGHSAADGDWWCTNAPTSPADSC